MGHKFGFYSVKLPLEDVLYRTLEFWKFNRGQLLNQVASPNKLLHTLTMKRGISMGSYGETYLFNIGFDPNNSTTYIIVDVSLSLGTGLQWRTPQNLIKKWAQYTGINPMRLTRIQDQNFIAKFNEMKIITGLSSNKPDVKYCSYCGKENDVNNNYCKNCGENIESA